MTFKHTIIACCSLIFCLSIAIAYQVSLRLPKKIRPYIVCTTTIIADAVKNIGQESLDVICLMGPGIDPHLYKPVESDVIKIASADIIFYNGLHLEAKMADLFEHLSKKQTTIAVTADIPKNMLLAVNDYDQIFDPHVWFDINLWMYAIETISKNLIKKFPEHAQMYKKNCQKYIDELQQLLIQTHHIMDLIPQENKILITGHDAFSYFGRLYNCKVIGLQGISTESAPGIYDIAKIIEIICEQNIPAIFIESSIPIKNIIALQQGVATAGKYVKLGGQLYSDALDIPGSSGDTYSKMFLHNVQTISSALILRI